MKINIVGETVDVLQDDRPIGYVGPILWDEATQRIYPDPSVEIRAKLEALAKMKQLQVLKESDIVLTAEEIVELDSMIDKEDKKAKKRNN